MGSGQPMGRGHPAQQGPGGAAQLHQYRGPPPEPPGQEWMSGQQDMGMGWTGDGSAMGPGDQQMTNYGAMGVNQQGGFQQSQQPQQQSQQQHMQQQQQHMQQMQQQQQPHMQQQQHPGDMGQLGRPGGVQQMKPLKGVPAVVPDFVIPANKESPTTAAPAATASSGPSFPSAPNFMQKISEMTGAGSGSGGATGESSMDNLLSKGKELIFKKFGLGD